MAKLHATQQKILAFLKKQNASEGELSLRSIGEAVGIGKKPQVVAHHLGQLEKKGFIRKDSSKKLSFTVLSEPIEDVVYVNMYQFAECGPEGLFGDDEVIDRVPLSSRQFGIANPDNFFLIKARGNSMKPMIDSGDLVLAKETQEINNGDIAVVVHNQMPKIKQLLIRHAPEGNFYSLFSLNAENKRDFPVEIINPQDDDFRIVGKVKSVIKNNL